MYLPAVSLGRMIFTTCGSESGAERGLSTDPSHGGWPQDPHPGRGAGSPRPGGDVLPAQQAWLQKRHRQDLLSRKGWGRGLSPARALSRSSGPRGRPPGSAAAGSLGVYWEARSGKSHDWGTGAGTEKPRDAEGPDQKGYYRASSSVTSSLVMTTCSGTSCQENPGLQEAATDPHTRERCCACLGVCTPPPVTQRGLGAQSENPWGQGPTQNPQHGAAGLGSCILSKAPGSAIPDPGPLCGPALRPSPKTPLSGPHWAPVPPSPRAHLMLRDVDEQLLLQKLLQDVLGGHVDQGLKKRDLRLGHDLHWATPLASGDAGLALEPR
ncbi:hypothetical protein PAL_GLEAN10005925 [Pteropus alecto]|uniref:Uncharacterized protein n=1 Tax=Pteropus alecto TaxID=9402 RepID=L5L6E1_PTEAL|nr:hypothetical protein PAL_GLEAN10005925 [Pteropus alecto]